MIDPVPGNRTFTVFININAWDKTEKPSRKRQRSEDQSTVPITLPMTFW